MRLGRRFYERDVLTVAPELLGKTLVRKSAAGKTERWMITETEAYRGEEDLACHASRGKTERTKVMYEAGGLVYVYFIYGMYWLLNIVTGKGEQPQAALIRGVTGINGPGRVGKVLGLDKSFYGEDLMKSKRIWLEETLTQRHGVTASRRIGVEYAGEWAKKPWRFRPACPACRQAGTK